MSAVRPHEPSGVRSGSRVYEAYSSDLERRRPLLSSHEGETEAPSLFSETILTGLDSLRAAIEILRTSVPHEVPHGISLSGSRRSRWSSEEWAAGVYPTWLRWPCSWMV